MVTRSNGSPVKSASTPRLMSQGASGANNLHRPISAGSSCIETFAMSAERLLRESSSSTVPRVDGNGGAPGHLSSKARRHSPPGPMSESLETQLAMTARALTLARCKLDEEYHKRLTANKSEAAQRALATEARADAERAWQSAWHSAEQQRIKSEGKVATRLQHDRRNLEERLRREHEERAQELEWRVAVEVDARETRLPGLKIEMERRGRSRFVWHLGRALALARGCPAVHPKLPPTGVPGYGFAMQARTPTSCRRGERDSSRVRSQHLLVRAGGASTGAGGATTARRIKWG